MRKGAPELVALFCLGLIGWGAWRSVQGAEGFRAGPVLVGVRVLGLVLAVGFALPVAVPLLHDHEVRPLMWRVLAASVALIVPLGAAVLEVLVGYGVLDGVGVLMRPLMRPLFRLPGRAALDDLMSWLGSYSVGLYLTRRLVEQGAYTRREAYLIVTAFSTVSVGFVGVVCSTLDLLPLFPVVFATYFVVVYLLAILQARVWPVSSVPDTPLPGTVGTFALLVAHHTPLFAWCGLPLVPVLELLGMPDAEQVAPAVVAGITEMYIRALLVQGASEPARFFVAVLSISQLVFFSSVGPMILDMFRDLPVRAWELVGVFLLRTAVRVPLLALVTHGLLALGVLQP